MAINILTTKGVEAARARGRYGDGDGLVLQISKWGTKSWVFRYRRGGRDRHMGLGPVHVLSLAEARERAGQCRKLLLDGLDPIEQRERQEERKRLEEARAQTFRACAESYIAAHSASWQNAKHREQWSSTLETYAYPVIGALPVAGVDMALVLKCIEPIWEKRPETAKRLRGRIENILGWATVRGYRAGDNPARWRGHLDKLLPASARVRAVKHHAALPYAELPAFTAKLRARDEIPLARSTSRS